MFEETYICIFMLEKVLKLTRKCQKDVEKSIEKVSELCAILVQPRTAQVF